HSRWFPTTQAEQGHSSHPRPRFGKWARSTPEWQHSAPSFVLLLILGLLISRVVEARTFVLKADGTGDVLTFQAGVDSLIVNHACADRDTLFVGPGSYEENVVVDLRQGNYRNCLFQGAIVAYEGFERTQVRGLSFAQDTGPVNSQPRLLIEGLTVKEPVAQGVSQQWCLWRRCRFAGGFTSSLRLTSIRPPFESCEFQGFATLQGYGPSATIEGCRFISAPAHLDGREWDLILRDCTFVGPADTAVIVNPSPDGGVVFQSCTFADFERAIVLRQAVARDLFRLNDCSFRDIADAAIEALGAQPPFGFR
ncbi:MAG TPA: hypothetical protein VFP58_03335, partial [Candidatus Eisenbacteria bacterium]|nr:hypothetical protein [Candidatus Eisenbacteria bacterium]